jgi:hypothetical protein
MMHLEAKLPAHEQALLARAARWPEWPAWTDLNEEALRDLAVRQGLDFATAVLFDRICRAPEHGPFIERLGSLPASVPAVKGRESLTVAIVPGAFYRTRPQTGADGSFILDHLARFGFQAERIPLHSFGSLRANATLIGDWLRQRPARRVILVSLSKGGAETKIALGQPDAGQTFRSVAAWINLSGLLQGTPLAGLLLARAWRVLLVRLLFRLRGYDFTALGQLERKSGSLLDARLSFPDHLRVIHIVGFPLRAHLSCNLAARNYRLLAALGPNDGGGILLGDLCRFKGLIYPLWGADHFLRPAADLRSLVCRLLHYVIQEA